MLIPVLDWLDYKAEIDQYYKDNDKKPAIGEALDQRLLEAYSERDFYKEAYATNNNTYGTRLAEKDLKRQNISYDKNSKAFKKIRRLFSEALIEEMEKTILSFKSKPIPSFINPKFKRYENKPISLSQIIKNFIRDNSENWADHTQESNITALELIEDFFGPKKELHTIDRDDCRSYRDFINNLASQKCAVKKK